MIKRLIANNRTLTILVGSILAVLAVCFLFFRINTNHTIGWETKKKSQQPSTHKNFKPGLITNGQSPATFDISLVEPKPDSPIKVKAGSTCQISVKFNILDTNATNGSIPPTFVFIKIIENINLVSKIVLSPSGKNNGEYFYSGEIATPTKIGNYELDLEVEYAVIDTTTGALKQLEPFRRTTKGATINVYK